MLRTTTCNYAFHGLRVAVSANYPEIVASVHSRLRQFVADGHGSPDLSFEFYSVPSSGKHLIEKPQGPIRPVYNSTVVEVVYSDTKDQLYMSCGDKVRVLCDPKEGYARISILKSEIHDSLWLLSHPMFTLPFIELLKRRKRYSLHAAGLSLDGQGLLLPGTSGSGKTTLSLALLRAGFDFLGDDMVFLAQGKEGLRVCAFPDEIDVTDQTASFYPELHQLLNQPKVRGWPKRLVLAEAVYGIDFVRECQPLTLVFPMVARVQESLLKPMSQDEALLELAPNILLTEARASQAHFDVLAELVRQCACYRLEMGRDLETLPMLLRDVVESSVPVLRDAVG